MGDKMGKTKQLDIYARDTQMFHELMENLKDGDKDAYEGLSNLRSSLLYLVVKSISKENKDTSFEPFKMRRIKESNELYISNKYKVYDIDPNSSSFDNFILDDEYDNECRYLLQSCTAKVIMNIKTSYDKYYSARKDPILQSKRLTLSSIVSICQDKEYIEGNEIELTVEESIKWFKEHNLGVEFYEMDNILLIYYINTILKSLIAILNRKLQELSIIMNM
jgi:hypothetical protein